MGLFRSLAKRVATGIGAIKQDATHPGRPPTFRAAANPFVAEPEDRIAHEKAKEAIRAAAVKKPAATTPGPTLPTPAATATERPWYLDGENDGWDETNPEPDKK